MRGRDAGEQTGKEQSVRSMYKRIIMKSISCMLVFKMNEKNVVFISSTYKCLSVPSLKTQLKCYLQSSFTDNFYHASKHIWFLWKQNVNSHNLIDGPLDVAYTCPNNASISQMTLPGHKQDKAVLDNIQGVP